MKYLKKNSPFSDLLDHQYDLQLVNVFDTLAAHMVFASRLTRQEIHRQATSGVFLLLISD